ncbi:MAG: hypothetical protein ACE5R6_10645 [Candidatus Heimdallarchaeota archaeon]
MMSLNKFRKTEKTQCQIMQCSLDKTIPSQGKSLIKRLFQARDPYEIPYPVEKDDPRTLDEPSASWLGSGEGHIFGGLDTTPPLKDIYSSRN